MTIDATIGGASANSYATVEQADAYFALRPDTDDWDDLANDAAKEPYLVQATRLIDYSFDWFGSPSDINNQALRWPRAGVVGPDLRTIENNTLPVLFVEAFLELALSLVGDDRTRDSDLVGQGFTEARIDVISVKVDQNAVRGMIPANVTLMLSEFGRLKPGAGASGAGFITDVRRV